MSRHPSGPADPGLSRASVPSEALLFARAITGDPSRGSAPNDAGLGMDCEYLEWLAAISPEYERRLRNLAKIPGGDELRREQLEWLASISPEYARQLRDLQREEAIAAEERERSKRIIERLEYVAEIWDDSKHPRAGGPPNAGWFVATGGSGRIASLRANASPKPDTLARPKRQRDEFAQAPLAAGLTGSTADAVATDASPEIQFHAGDELVQLAQPAQAAQPSQAAQPVQAASNARLPFAEWLKANKFATPAKSFNNVPIQLNSGTITLDSRPESIGFGKVAQRVTITFAPNANYADARVEFIQIAQMVSDFPNKDGMSSIMLPATGLTKLGRDTYSPLIKGFASHMVTNGPSAGWGVDLDYGSFRNSPFYNASQPNVQAFSRQMSDRPTGWVPNTTQYIAQFVTAVYAPGHSGKEWLGSVAWGAVWTGDSDANNPPFEDVFYNPNGFNNITNHMSAALQKFMQVEAGLQHNVRGAPFNVKGNQ